ncbi:Wall-associated protein precursor [Stigmatella hybrida]|uniref:Wall-associated protein precursor n=1 Tax=Stigmatella hybrida TaxID=394097 RepID=UPI001CDB0447|nr:Wall-associated protein precursor [Stigmatella hybrida]
MLPLLLLLITTQAPPVPGETTLVSFCKQGRMTACQELKKLFPDKYAELAKAALRQEAAVRGAEEAARGEADLNDAEAAGTQAAASGKPPHCDGQNHHIISRPIANALDEHRTLRGLYAQRDARFVAKAKDKESHCGYQDWHRKVDAEVIQWLRDHDKATPAQFMQKLREIYSRKDMRERFPHGF